MAPVSRTCGIKYLRESLRVIADRRDHLDLQVNLLTEKEATQIIQMLDRLSTHLGVEQHHDDGSRELGQHIAVEHLVDELRHRLPDVPGGWKQRPDARGS